MGASNQEAQKDFIRETIRLNGVRFIRLQFTDMFGHLKNIVIPSSQLEKAMDNSSMFDGSSIDGFVRIEESDMYLYPDLSTFVVMPESIHQGRSARFICDVYTTEGRSFEADPRAVLRRVMEDYAKLGLSCDAGPEMEFFLFDLKENGLPSMQSTDKGGYFDLGPSDIGEAARQEMVLALEDMGFEIEAAHHEVANAQHEIDFKYTDALHAADQVMTFKYVVKAVAAAMGLHSSFMAKPFFGQAGNGMHLNLSVKKNGKNLFFDANDEMGLSLEARYFIGGLMKHAKAITAITNPTVNSYKRLVPDYEAPCFIAWSAKNRSPLIRIPSARGASTRVELRSPDTSCNPYLALAVTLAAGLDGIKNKILPPAPINANIFAMSDEERANLAIEALPTTIIEAIQELEKDSLIAEVLGKHLFTQFTKAKKQEWKDFYLRVSEWERETYLSY